MKPYDPESTCPKCGHPRARTEYKWGTDQFTDDGTKLPDTPPYLVRECLRCGFGWREAPLDAQETKAC